MRFPPNFIERLRSHFLMSEVVGKRIPLKKFGREWKACCPFHNEKTPSFTVNDEKSFYHCFGCGAHGDAIEFIRKYERLSYPESVETLARDAGIPLPEVSPETMRKIEAYKVQHDVVETACLWFEKQLHSARHVDALSYVEKRGLTAGTIRQFRLGFAPDERTALHQHLTENGHNLEQQIQAGLVSKSDDGKVYDRFRGRIIFPIRNSAGKVIAFGGRLLGNNTNKNLAKYLNSPETDLFKKGEVLFNLDLAKRPARDKNCVVVMEGYMDVVSTSQSGIDYAVATLGTAVTPEHLRQLWQLAKEPIFCLDGDAAGSRAMLRAAEIALPLIKPGFSLRFAVLPKGEDPDTYIQKHGKESFEKLLGHSKRLSQVLWEALSPQYKLNLAEGRAGLEGAFKKMVGQIEDTTVKQHFLTFFKKQLWDATNSKKPQPKARSNKVEQVVAQHHSTALEMLTSRMLKTLVIFPSLLERAAVEEFVSHVTIATPRMITLRDALLTVAHEAITEAEPFRARVIDVVQESWCIEFVADALKLPYSASLSANDAMVLWNETVSAYQIAHMQHELNQLQEQMGGMDEEGLKRLVDLQNAIRAAQTARTFAPMQSDSV